MSLAIEKTRYADIRRETIPIMIAGSPNGPNDSDDEIMVPTAPSKEDVKMEVMSFRMVSKASKSNARRYRRPFSSWLMNDLDRSFGQFKGFKYDSQDL